MSAQLRHDIPVLLLVIAFALIAIGVPSIDYWLRRTKYDKSIRLAASAIVVLLLLFGGLIALIRLPGSEDIAVYLAIAGGGVVYALGFYARNRIVDSWSSKDWSTPVRYVLAYRLLYTAAAIAGLTAGVAIYEAVR